MLEHFKKQGQNELPEGLWEEEDKVPQPQPFGCRSARTPLTCHSSLLSRRVQLLCCGLVHHVLVAVVLRNALLRVGRMATATSIGMSLAVLKATKMNFKKLVATLV